MSQKEQELRNLQNQFIFGQHTRYRRICAEEGVESVEQKIVVAKKVLFQFCSGGVWEAFHESRLLKKMK
ncbi:hypothetical protein [Rubinisphaera sp. JC750]|uniref:hypothetical protein n=1 Tax=Rubinisphaera sp. JC750 TaxID=2898658 RepID=UPI001F2821B1|nr:hypothetical protein [Rubinisphaera sp. JC750]